MRVWTIEKIEFVDGSTTIQFTTEDKRFRPVGWMNLKLGEYGGAVGDSGARRGKFRHNEQLVTIWNGLTAAGVIQEFLKSEDTMMEGTWTTQVLSTARGIHVHHRYSIDYRG